MTVGELKEKLDDYGDHLEVKVAVWDARRERDVLADPTVEDINLAGEIVVTLAVEV